MFDRLVKDKAIVAKDAVMDDLAQDAKKGKGVFSVVFGIVGAVGAFALAMLFGGGHSRASTGEQSIVNNIYIVKGDFNDED